MPDELLEASQRFLAACQEKDLVSELDLMDHKMTKATVGMMLDTRLVVPSGKASRKSRTLPHEDQKTKLASIQARCTCPSRLDPLILKSETD